MIRGSVYSSRHFHSRAQWLSGRASDSRRGTNSELRGSVVYEVSGQCRV